MNGESSTAVSVDCATGEPNCFKSSFPIADATNNCSNNSPQADFSCNDKSVPWYSSGSTSLPGSDEIKHNFAPADCESSSRTLYIPGPPYASEHCPDRWTPAEGSMAKSTEDMAYQYLYPVPSFLANLRQRNHKAAAGQSWSPRAYSPDNSASFQRDNRFSTEEIDPRRGAARVSILSATNHQQGRHVAPGVEASAVGEGLQFSTPRTLSGAGVASKFNSSSMFAAESNGFGLLTPGFSIMDDGASASSNWTGAALAGGAGPIGVSVGNSGTQPTHTGMMRDLLVAKGGTGDNIWTLPRKPQQEQQQQVVHVQPTLGDDDDVGAIPWQFRPNHVPLVSARSPVGSGPAKPAHHQTPWDLGVPVRLMARFPHASFTSEDVAGKRPPIAGRILDEPIVQQSFAAGPALALEGTTGESQFVARSRNRRSQEGRETARSCACFQEIMSLLQQKLA